MKDKKKITSKLIYLASLAGMCVLIYGVAWVFFLRTQQVDLTKNLKFTYSGENGTATVEVTGTQTDLNQRLEEFLESCTYTADPDTGLANGDRITVVAHYDHELASRYHFEPVHIQRVEEVSGLPERFSSARQISAAFLQNAQAVSEPWIRDHQATVLKALVPSKAGQNMQMSVQLEYSAFLKAREVANTDRLVLIYQVTFSDGRVLYENDYMVTIPEVNTSEAIPTRDLYGEEAYISPGDVQNGGPQAYIERVYGNKYDIETLVNIPERQKQEEKASEDESGEEAETNEENVTE